MVDDLIKDTLARIAKERGVSLPAANEQAAQPEAQPQALNSDGTAVQPSSQTPSRMDAFKQAQEQQQQGDQGPSFLDNLGTAAEGVWNSLKDNATGAMNVDRAVVGGAAKAIFNTRDTIADVIGEPTGEDSKTSMRKAVEQDYNEVTSQSTTAGILGPVSEFLTGLFGAGKLLEPLKLAEKGGKAVQLGYETAKGAIAGFTVMDPHTQRLSDMIQQYPALENPVTAFLASSPEDTDMEARLKNAAEGAGLDVGTAAAFTLGVKAIKLFRLGDREGAKQALIQLSHEQEGSDAAWARPTLNVQPQGKVVEGFQDPLTGGKPKVPAGIFARPEASLGAPTAASEASAKVVLDANGESGSVLLPGVPEPVIRYNTFKKGGKVSAQVSEAELPEALRGKGLGTAAYRALADDVVGKGGTLFSDSVLSADAARVYDTLASQGYKVLKAKDFTVREDGQVAGKGGAYRITALPKDAAAVSDKNRLRVQAGSEKFDLQPTEMSPGKVADDVISHPITEPFQEAKPAAVNPEAVSREKPGETPVGGQTIETTTEQAKATTQKLKPLPEAITPEEVAKVAHDTEWDLQRLEQVHWDFEEAMRQSNGAVEPSQGFPWSKINTPEDVNVFINHLMKIKEGDLFAAKGGVLSDAKVQRQVRQIATFYNTDPDFLVGYLSKLGDAGRTSVAELQAKFLVNARMFVDARSTLEDIRWGKIDRALGMEKVRKQLNIGYQVQKSAMMQLAEAGRLLRSARKDLQFGDYQKLLTLDDDKLESIIMSSGGDPNKMKDMANPGILKLASDELQFSMRNGLLWFYPSHVVNNTGNIFMQISRPAQKFIGAAMMGSKGRVLMREARKEYYYMAASIGDGLKASLEAALRGDSKLAPHYTEWMDQIGATQALNPDLRAVGFRPPTNFADLGHDALMAYRVVTGVPTRFLGAQDEFYKTIAYRGYVQARAAVMGEEQGLTGANLRQYVEDRLKDAFDSSGRAIDKDALYEAQVRVFNQELEPGTFGFGLRNFRGNWPAMGFFLPFIKTPVNVLRYAVKLTPGLNVLAQKEYRQMLRGYRGAEQQAQAIGQLATGGLIMGFFAMLAAHGRITGALPSNKEAAKQLREMGVQPYSYVTDNEDGTKTYTPYSRFDPVGFPAGVAADLHTYYHAGMDLSAWEDAATATTISMAQALSNRAFLTNINQVIDAMSDPNANAGKFVGNQLASMIPFSSAMRGYINQDPYQREARDLVDRILKDIPGYSETIPPERDWLGEPVLRQLGLSKTTKGDPVYDEAARLVIETNGALSPPSPVQGTIDLRTVKIGDRSAFDLWMDDSRNPVRPGGKTLHQDLEDMINSKLYADMVDGDRVTRPSKFNTLEGIVNAHRDAAKARLYAANPKLALEALRKDAIASDKFQENRTGQPGNAVNLLDALGNKGPTQ